MTERTASVHSAVGSRPGFGDFTEDLALVGQNISHYTILEKLGEGGMGVVYAAHDTSLDRPVALKFLSPRFAAETDDRERLVREAKAASSLDHPGVCTVHEIAEAPDGRLFIVMALYDGMSLARRVEDGPLPVEEAVDIAAQVADGLQAAHRKGIVHRDIKSGNVMLAHGTRAVLMDFGLALAPNTTKLTKTGATLGTIPYMSPEQARGERADHRSDIWSLGVVLYEMITGQLPFRSEYELAALYSILNEDPLPPGRCRPGVPEELDRIVLKAMHKDASARYGSAGEMARDLRALSRTLETGGAPVPADRGHSAYRPKLLRWALVASVILAVSAIWRLATPHSDVIDSIAVLPLSNLTGDPEQEYFVDGMHEALIAELAGIHALKVISRTSAMRYKDDRSTPLPQIARELGVRGLVEGSVAREGNEVRIIVQLIHGPDDRHLWQGSFERELRSVLALQGEVARAIAEQIRVAVTTEERARLSPEQDVHPDAYEAYLLGRHYLNRRTLHGMEQAVDRFRAAVDLDPSYVPAYIRLVEAYMLLGEQGGMSQEDARMLGGEALSTALEIDRDLTEADPTVGHWKLHFEFDWVGAVRAFERAIELNPGDADAYRGYARGLGALRRFGEAEEYARRAVNLDPLSAVAGAYLGQVLLYAGRYDEAEAELRRTAEINPDHALILHNMGEVNLARGRFLDAIGPLERSVELSGQVSGLASSHYLAILGAAYAQAGREEEAIVVRDQLAGRYASSRASEFDLAIITLFLGDREGCLGWLEDGLRSRDVWLAEINAWPWFDSLLGDPRFQAVLRTLAFPDVPGDAGR